MSHPVKSVLAAVAFILLAFLAALYFGDAHAGVTVTETSQRFQLYDGQGAPIKELVGNQLVPVVRNTLAECKTKGESEFRTKLTVDEAPFRCIQVTVVTFKGTCDDEPQPGPEEAIEGTLDADGFTIVAKLETAACVADDTKFDLSEVKWVKKSWRDKCWEKVVTPLKKCDDPPLADAVERVPGDLLDLPGGPTPGSDPAEVCKTADCNDPNAAVHL